jgi:hypothetical protein
MAVKNEQPTTAQASDINTIRNILMGAQMADYAAQFQSIESEIAATKAHFSKEMEDARKMTDDRFARLEKDMSARFDKLEKVLADHVNRLDKKLIEVSKTDKQDLGKMLADLSKKLTSND